MTDTSQASSSFRPLRVIGVSRTFGVEPNQVHALRHATFEVAAGELVLIKGPSGAGKSTLIALLGALDVPSAGYLEVEGRRLDRMRQKDLALLRRRRIGFLLQFFGLLPTLTAVENVALPLRLDKDAGADARATETLERLGLSDRLDHRPSELSGGEQQRVALARAMVISPALLLADEPTGALDRETGAEILALLRDSADAGQTIIMVSHDPHAQTVADRVLDLVDGDLAEA